MTKFVSLKVSLIVLAFWLASVGSSAQTLTTLYSFGGSDGEIATGLVQGLDGNFYGTTAFGGTNHEMGTSYKITPDGIFTLISNTGSAGSDNLILANDGNLYGVTLTGGTTDRGTLFKETTDGVVTTLYSFCSRPHCKDGMAPVGSLLQADDGNFYGTTDFGGSGPYCTLDDGCGVVFRFTPEGEFTLLYSFCTLPNCADGNEPQSALIEGPDRVLYGTTTSGGRDGDGTVFQFASPRTSTTLHSFRYSDGTIPYAGVVLGAGGTLYGAASAGGTSDCGENLNRCGTIYSISAEGQFEVKSLTLAEGAEPYDSLLLATDGNFYGPTSQGGSFGNGSIIKVTPSGQITNVYNFCTLPKCADGASPSGALIQGTDGKLYGTTAGSGANRNGTVFSLDIGLGPFIKTVPIAGKPASSVFILGNNLTGTTSVTFNGTPATFTVVTATEIKTTVPAGASSGTVQVTTPSGTLNSNVNFQVIP